MSTATVMRTVKEIEGEIQSISIRRGKLEGEHGRLSERLMRIDGQERELKVKLAGGDKSAASALDLLESERKDIGRKIEGLRVPIDEFEAQTATLQREAQALRVAAAAEERRKQSEASCDNLEASKVAIESVYEDLSLRIAEFQLDCGDHGERFGQEGQAYVAKLIEGMWNQFYRLNTIKKWKAPVAPYGHLFFEIRGLLPPQHKRVPKAQTSNISRG